MEKKITHAQAKILKFIARQTQENGYPPTIREIQDHCGYRSPRAVSFHLDNFQLHGYLERTGHGRARTIRLTRLAYAAIGAAHPARTIPILGAIAAGFPTLEEAATQSEESLEDELDQYHTPRHFALRVRGFSMIDAHILEGDIVIAENRPAVPGDIVVAVIDSEVTLKRLLKVNGKFVLQAENAAYPQMEPLEQLTVQGVVVGIHRHL